MTPIEVFKLAIGPFFGAVTGASLAFTFNWLVQWRLQRRDDIAAGNLALFRLYRIIHEASMLRAQIRTRLAEDEHANPGAPIWSFHDPLLHTFQMVEALDYGPLTFLLKTEQGKKTLCDVNVADRIYAELQDQWRLLRETNADLKKEVGRIVASHPDGIRATMPWGDLELALGAYRISQATVYKRELVIKLETIVKPTALGFCELETVLVHRFGERRVWRQNAEPAPEYMPANLPPIQEWLRGPVERAGSDIPPDLPAWVKRPPRKILWIDRI